MLADKYRVESVLGVGGMGMVVAAEHVELRQKVAIKFMLPEALRSEILVDRFMREARAAVSLRSEHVARVLDVGKLETGAPYIVMEYLEGEDLAAVVSDRVPLPAKTAIDYVLQACIAMGEAHKLGIVHRDLKPANLFITRRPDGSAFIKILDFGISKIKLDDDEVSQTQTSTAMGSPGYMAPEQMRSARQVDPRADIWSLGCILYQLLSNTLPFEGDTAPEMFAAVLGGDPQPLQSVASHLDPLLIEAVHRCLENDREERFANVGQLAKALAPHGDSNAKKLAASVVTIVGPSPEEGDDEGGQSPSSTATSEPSRGDYDVGATVSSTPTSKKGKGVVTTREASACEVSPLETYAPPSNGKGKPLAIGVVIAVVAAAALYFTVTGGGEEDAEPARAATPPVDERPAAAIAPDASVADAALDASVADASVPDAAVEVVPATRKRRPTRPAPRVPKVEEKKPPKPKAPKDDDPFGTMQ